jgi:hypothetical protein
MIGSAAEITDKLLDSCPHYEALIWGAAEGKIIQPGHE